MANQLKDWLRPPLDEVGRSMVVRRHQQMAEHPSTANHALRYFRSIYNHARRTHDLPESPTMAIEWFEEVPDGRTIDDLQEGRRKIDGLENPSCRVFYEFLLFTELRTTEAFTLQGSQVQKDRIHLPITKNGRSFDLPILQHHYDILEAMRPLSRTWVFPSPQSVSGHITRPERLKYNPHMHRQTHATVAIETGVLEDIVGRL